MLGRLLGMALADRGAHQRRPRGSEIVFSPPSPHCRSELKPFSRHSSRHLLGEYNGRCGVRQRHVWEAKEMSQEREVEEQLKTK